jgi:hypothetical protein
MKLLELELAGQPLNAPRLRIPGTFLISHCEQQAKFHLDKAEFYRKHAKEMDTEHRGLFDGHRNTSQAAPADVAEAKAEEHDQLAVMFKLRAKFLDSEERYDITDVEVRSLELRHAQL